MPQHLYDAKDALHDIYKAQRDSRVKILQPPPAGTLQATTLRRDGVDLAA